jgi:hypothetical protein
VAAHGGNFIEIDKRLDRLPLRIVVRKTLTVAQAVVVLKPESQ